MTRLAQKLNTFIRSKLEKIIDSFLKVLTAPRFRQGNLEKQVSG